MTLIRRRAGGFTLIEMMVAIAILSILIAVGIPSMQSWMASTRATAAAEFYAEGMRMARAEALRRNVVSRLTLTPNATNGQQDWQVDICVPSSDKSCQAPSSTWSTPTTALTGENVADFKSVFRSAGNLPSSEQMTIGRFPAGADDVYFTPIGWVDGSVLTNLNKVVISPSANNERAFPTAALVLTGGGAVIKCNPGTELGAKDSRKCPPT